MPLRYPAFSGLAGGFENPGPRGFFFAQDSVHGLNSAGIRLLEETLLATDTY